MVINKPYGMLVHEDWTFWHRRYGGGQWFLNKIPSAFGVGEDTEKPDGTKLERSGIVHRLDRETSGVMILAKTTKPTLS
jgi:23S rRNA-/tRNA-specific pseudouridylate synthase